MPWKPISDLPEEAKDGRLFDVWVVDGSTPKGCRIPGCKWGYEFDDFKRANPGPMERVQNEFERWRYEWRRLAGVTHFYDFGDGRTMPDAPEEE